MTPRSEAYFLRNKEASFWLPKPVYEWLEEYLKKTSTGNSFSERMRIFVYRLQEMDEKGLSLFKTQEPEPKQSQFLTRLGDLAENPQAICLRRTIKTEIESWLKLEQWQRDRACEMCKAQRGEAFYRTCRELRKEQAGGS